MRKKIFSQPRNSSPNPFDLCHLPYWEFWSPKTLGHLDEVMKTATVVSGNVSQKPEPVHPIEQECNDFAYSPELPGPPQC